MDWYKPETVIRDGLSIMLDISTYFGVFLIAVTVTYILLLFGVDLFDFSSYCTFAISDTNIKICELIKRPYVVAGIGIFIVLIWIAFIPLYRKVTALYNKSSTKLLIFFVVDS